MIIRKFSFKLIPSVITLLAFLLMCKLGFWQLDRAHQKRQEIQAFGQLEELSAEELVQQAQTQVVSLHGRRAQLKGVINNRQFWLVDNKTHNGKIGYSVVVKMQLAGVQPPQASAILVDLGWVAGGKYRDSLPNVQLPVTLDVKTTLKAKNFEQLVLADTLETAVPQRVQSYRQLFTDDVPALIAFADSDTISGMPQLYQPVVMPPEKHVAYAVQWFLLAAASLVVYVFASCKTTRSSEVKEEKIHAS